MVQVSPLFSNNGINTVSENLEFGLILTSYIFFFHEAISLSAHEVLKAWKNRVAPTFEEAREKLRDIFDNIGLKSDFENGKQFC